MMTQMATEDVSTGLAKTLMPVPDPHPDVFDTQWPLRVADIDRVGRLKFDAACRHIQDVGSDQLREMGFEDAALVFGDVEPVVRDARADRRSQGRADGI